MLVVLEALRWVVATLAAARQLPVRRGQLLPVQVLVHRQLACMAAAMPPPGGQVVLSIRIRIRI